MDILFDFSPIMNAAYQGPLAFAWFLFIRGAWVIFLIYISYFIYIVWLQNRQGAYQKTIKFVLLAIDVPKDTEQTPKAIEQLFATISGAHTPLTAKEIYWEGKYQLSFSFEIVSIDGYVQFLIRTPEQYRDLVESSIYSQYPDAEITEVNDYVNEIPDKYPNETHNIWGAEVILARNWVYPIRTYRYFEDMVSGEFKDPMASLLETMSKIQIGEQVWLQIIVKPTGFDWIEKSTAEANKLAGKKKPKKQGFFSSLFNSIFGIFFLSTGETWFFQQGITPDKSSKKDEKIDPSMMLHLTPGEKATIEAIENKSSKNGFECKMRLVYSSPLEKFSSSRVISSVFGSIKQFNTLDLNAFKPDPKTKTQIAYFFIEHRKNKRRERLVRAYQRRSGVAGHAYYILNNEELATIWHFPSKYVKAPMLQRTEAKKSEAPASLPKNIAIDQSKEDLANTLRKQLENGSAYNVDVSNKYFENRFAKNNENHSDNKYGRQEGQPPANLPTA
ncbi:MAG: hypothetical protein PHO91_04145 [Patescibacteria group bacterium]|nr:hypothetical protein [Patescibacteria group bacterium]